MMDFDIDPVARASIEALVIEFAWLIDHGKADATAALFTEDGCLLGMGDDIVGQAALTAWSVNRAAMHERTSRHVCSNIRLVREAPGQISGTTLLTLYRHDGPSIGRAMPFLIGEFEDLYRRDDAGCWRFSRRRFVAVFNA